MAEQVEGAEAFTARESRGREQSQTHDQSSTDDIPMADEEEMKLLETSEAKPSIEIVFKDGNSQIDFVLTYKEEEPKMKLWLKKHCSGIPCALFPGMGEISEEERGERRARREYFLRSCVEKGLDYKLSSDFEEPLTYFIHCTHHALLLEAEKMFLRMPMKDSKITQEISNWREWFFDSCIKVGDPFDPLKPEDEKLKVPSHFTAPFKYEHRENFEGWEEDTFFTSAERSAIVWNIMQDVRFGDEEDDTNDDQVGLLRLLDDKSFTASYPLHEGDYKVDDGAQIETDRQLLYYRWAKWKNWYKVQPLDNIRRYFGEKVGIYFAWLGFYTTWLIPASFLGLIVFFYGLSTLSLNRNPVAADICREENRTDYYMCPLCDERCDFWWLRDTCAFARVALLFDNGATVFFAIFMSFWAVLFLEFWKRRQFYLQYDWEMLGYETAEERARPEFVHRIKNSIKKTKPEKRKKFYVTNEVLNKVEYIQPAYWFYPKLVFSFSILITMVAVVLAIVIAVLFYRLAVSGLIYHLVASITGGPSAADIAVSITGAAIQLISIVILNKVYEYLAIFLNNWELHRTQSDYDDSFITKMYLFQFVNYYSSIFYIAFFKGKFSGYPGGYHRIGGLRLDECSTYGCLLELTIQLAIIMVGKALVNNVVELGVPYAMRFLNRIKEKKGLISKTTVTDKQLSVHSSQALFYEYLELVIQYGFVTVFVAAFPLAPLCALVNNLVEIRLDAKKFVKVFRRPVPVRAQDIGAWFTVLHIVSSMAVLTNGLLIAITAQFIPFQVYVRGGYSAEYIKSIENSSFGRDTKVHDLSGYIQWSTSPFALSRLLDGQAFPAYSAQALEMYDDSGNEVTNDNGESILYLPFIDFECLYEAVRNNVSTSAFFSNYSDPLTDRYVLGFTDAQYDCFYGHGSCSGTGADTGQFKQLVFDAKVDHSPRQPTGPCARLDGVHCQFRGHVNMDGSRPVQYWQIWTARLAFVLIFEVLIRAVSAFLDWLVPDVPKSVLNQIKREKYLANEAIHIRHELNRSPTPAKESTEDSIFTTRL